MKNLVGERKNIKAMILDFIYQMRNGTEMNIIEVMENVQLFSSQIVELICIITIKKGLEMS